jgi:hypothetical protein
MVWITRGMGLHFQWGQIFFSSPLHPERLWGSLIFPSSGQWGFLSQGLMWLRHEADHSPSSSAEVKNMWSYNSVPPYAFIIKLRDVIFINMEFNENIVQYCFPD